MIRTASLRTALHVGTALAALTAVPAFAQETPAATETQADADAGDQEVVVTARRREETLLDVPIAISAFSGAQLEKSGAIDITDLSNVTPNVTLENSRATNSTLTAFIRGVGQQDPVAGFEQGVGIYLDDVYLNRPQAAVLDIYDVERIEVLRGPQGTLYGRNTVGGAVKYVTRRLPDHVAVSARATYGSYDQLDGVATLSAPIGDGTLRVGGSVARLTRDGFGDNLVTGRDNYNKDVTAGRLSLEVHATDFFARLAGDYTHDNSDPRNGHRLIVGQLSGAPVLNDVYDTRGGLLSPEQDIRSRGLSLFMEAQPTTGITFRSITAYRKDRSRTPIDFDALPAIDVDVPAIYKNRQLSQEVQLLIDTGGLHALIGGYYLDANANNIFDVILGTTGALLALPGFTASTFGNVDTDTLAVFGDLTYDFGDMFSVSVGGRYTRDNRKARIIRANLLGGASPVLGGAGVQLGARTSDFTGEKTFKKFTPRASVSFKPDTNNMIYASYSKGFKGGGFDPRGLSTAAPDLNGNGVREASEIFDYFLFDPETVDSYEAGYKASLFDRRVQIALAGFYAKYKDVQVPGSAGAIIGGVPTFVGVTTNAGKADFKGIEAELSGTLARGMATDGDRLKLSGTLGYIDAKYKSFVTNVANFDANGNPAVGAARPVDVAPFRKVQNTPKWTTSGTLDYTVPTDIGEVSATTTVSYRSKTYQFETPSPYLDQSGYSLWDASLVWNSKDRRFGFGLHAKNLTDKQYITSGYQFLTVNPVTGVPVLSLTPTVTGGGANPNFNKPGIAPSLGREGVVTAFYGNPRQVFGTFTLRF
ncbi:MAG: TonB-dependent receptor [Pseudomonadota bacterium]